MDGITDHDHQLEAAARAAQMGRQMMDSHARARVVWQGLQHHAQRDPVAVVAACDDALSILRGELPEPVFAGGAPYFTGQREECERWAEWASDGQIAAMLGACLARIGGTRLVVEDRKRLMVAIWNSLTADDRKAFRDRVMAKENSR